MRHALVSTPRCTRQIAGIMSEINSMTYCMLSSLATFEHVTNSGSKSVDSDVTLFLMQYISSRHAFSSPLPPANHNSCHIIIPPHFQLFHLSPHLSSRVLWSCLKRIKCWLRRSSDCGTTHSISGKCSTVSRTADSLPPLPHTLKWKELLTTN